MKLLLPAPRPRTAFTLIEMLVVVAIIAMVAALIFPVSGAVKKRQMISKAQSELKQVETAIEAYKARLGFYPPDNPGNPVTNQLYFELTGTVLTNIQQVAYFVTLDGSSRIRKQAVPFLFNNANLVGFANSSQTQQGTDESAPAVNFLKGLKPTQIGQMVVNGVTIPPLPALLVCSVNWPVGVPDLVGRNGNPYAVSQGLNPWRYVSSNPTHNPGSYDLWVDVVIVNVTNRVSNWNVRPELIQ